MPTKFWLPLVIVLFLFCLFLLSFSFSFKNPNMIYGVSFSPAQATYLGLDYKKVYTAILDDWNFKYIRLSVPWDGVEITKGNFDFSQLDWLMSEAGKRNAKIILAIGEKTPRWPECHTPDWAKNLSAEEYQADLQNYMTEVVNRYKGSPALETWQVENEPFVPFGVCQTLSKETLNAEVSLVKKIDSTHPILTTDSGELGFWRTAAEAGDLFGTTMYRIVWNKYLGYLNYNSIFPPLFYRAKLWLAGRQPSDSYIIELQAEPWLPSNDPKTTPLAEQYTSMNLEKLKENINFAENVGLSRVYLWGAEWWYWLREKGEMDIPNFIAQLKKQ